MDMIWHYDITHNDETIALANVFENLEKQLATVRRCQPGLAMVTTASEKVEILVPVITLQAGRHESTVRLRGRRIEEKPESKSHTVRYRECPTLCKKRKGWATLDAEDSHPPNEFLDFLL